MRFAAVVVALAGCVHETPLGSALTDDGGAPGDLTAPPGSDLAGTCTVDGECGAPARVCSADGRCIPGCATSGCPAGSTCDAATGQCQGGNLGKPCASDTACDPPDLVCKKSTMTCVPGCNLDPAVCYGGWICNFSTGRCCDPSYPDCRQPMPSGCNVDGDCASKPGTVCEASVCVPSCAMGGCVAPMVCMGDGHCGPVGACARDIDCDAGSYCTQAGACAVLPEAGAEPCDGGDSVSVTCNEKTSASTFKQCIGAPGAADCPWCIDGSCYRPGLCA